MMLLLLLMLLLKLLVLLMLLLVVMFLVLPGDYVVAPDAPYVCCAAVSAAVPTAVDVSTDIIVFIPAGDVVIVDVDYVVANVCH